MRKATGQQRAETAGHKGGLVLLVQLNRCRFLGVACSADPFTTEATINAASMVHSKGSCPLVTRVCIAVPAAGQQEPTRPSSSARGWRGTLHM